jgi:hypothetical protein
MSGHDCQCDLHLSLHFNMTTGWLTLDVNHPDRFLKSLMEVKERDKSVLIMISGALIKQTSPNSSATGSIPGFGSRHVVIIDEYRAV